METQSFGGNLVKRFELGTQGKKMLGSGPYEYYIYETQANETLTFKDLRSFSVYLFQKPAAAQVTVQGVSEVMDQGDRVQAEDTAVHLTVKNGPVKFLVAGTVNPHPSLKGLFFAKHADIYKVEKPWGHELWINGQHPCYALKQIFIKAGTKTSLQYHNFKQETNVLFEGTAKLHFKQNPAVENDHVTPADVTTANLEPISSVDVVPKTLHRLEAMTDILLCETSTPHLDDVVRVQDDSKRAHGRIDQEHKK